MSYTAQISRANPSCFIFLLDQSGSMEDPFAPGQSRAQGVATVINRMLKDLVMKCARGNDIRDFFHVAAIGYGQLIQSAFTGPLRGRDLVPIGDIAKSPARVEQKLRKVPDGVGGLVEEKFELPVWIDPIHQGSTPMTQAFQNAENLISGWLTSHSACYPPIVINITDGEADDLPSASSMAETLKRMHSSDGSILLFNIHISSASQNSALFPSSEFGLPDSYARALFNMSSELPPAMIQQAQDMGLSVGTGARGFAYNADMASLINALDVGTKTALSLSAAR